MWLVHPSFSAYCAGSSQGESRNLLTCTQAACAAHPSSPEGSSHVLKETPGPQHEKHMQSHPRNLFALKRPLGFTLSSTSCAPLCQQSSGAAAPRCSSLRKVSPVGDARPGRAAAPAPRRRGSPTPDGPFRQHLLERDLRRRSTSACWAGRGRQAEAGRQGRAGGQTLPSDHASTARPVPLFRAAGRRQEPPGCPSSSHRSGSRATAAAGRAPGVSGPLRGGGGGCQRGAGCCAVLCCAVQGGRRRRARVCRAPGGAPGAWGGARHPGCSPQTPPPPPGSCDRPSGGAGPVLERAEPRKEHGRERAARDGGGGGRGGGGGGVYRRGGFTLGLQRLAGGAAISFLTLWQHIASVRDWAP